MDDNNASGRIERIDYAIVLLFSICAIAISWSLSRAAPSIVYDKMGGWFGSDILRVVDDMAYAAANHYRSKVHPIFPILTIPPTTIVMWLGADARMASSVIMALSAAFCVGMLFLISRSIRLDRVDSAIVCGIFLSSSSFLFWWGVTETYPIGAAAMFFMFWVCLIQPRSNAVWIVAVASTLAATTTNWVLGLVAAFQFKPFKKFLVIAISSFILVAALSVLQLWLFPSSQLFFLPSSVAEEPGYIFMGRTSSLFLYAVDRVYQMIVYTGAVPRAGFIEYKGQILLQGGTIFDFTPMGIVSALLWIVLIAGGIVGSIWKTGFKQFKITVFVFMSFQIALHIVYGDEPFLYSAHFLPCAIVIIAFGFVSFRSSIWRIAGILYCVVAASSNIHELRQAAQLLEEATRNLKL